MQKLTLETVLPAIRKAVEEERLTAQNITGEPGNVAGCVYHRVIGGKDCGCAIGVTLDEETLERVSRAGVNSYSVGRLRIMEIVDFDDEDEEPLTIIQGSHDEWARAVGTDQMPLLRANFFVQLDKYEALVAERKQAAQ